MATKKQVQELKQQEKTTKVRLVGTVVSDKQEKTVVVKVTRTTRHPLYHKTMRHIKKYKAHNELGAAMGEKVMIEETRPISKDKRFIVTQVIERAKIADVADADKSDLDILLEHEAANETVATEGNVGGEVS